MRATERFVEYARRDRLRSPNTLARYRAVFADMEALGIDPADATVADVERWWDSRLEKSPATRANELACLRAFYKWATRFDHRPDDPTRRLDAPKVSVKVPRPIGRTDLEQCLAAARDADPALARALALGAYGGLRVSEAAALDWSDVDTESRRMYVTGKGRKQRLVPLGVILLDELLPKVDGNVVRAGEVPWSADTLQRKVNRFLAAQEVSHTSHDLRKRGASRALASGASPLAVAQVFGWSSIQTATHYAAVSDDELDKIAQAMV